MVYVAEKQHWDFAWYIGNLFFIIASSLGSYFFFGEVEPFFLSFMIASGSAYLIYFLILFVLTKENVHGAER